MSRYDEDLYENPFFVDLEAHNQDLFGKASSNRWIICIPKFSLLVKEKLGSKDFEDHILVPDPDHDGRFTTVSKHHVAIQDGHINLGAGFKDFKQIEILFEEVFYNANDESYRVLCVGDFFNRESHVNTSEDDTVWAKPPATYDECLNILWSRAGSGKTKEHLDKALLSYCSTYQKHEGDSIDNLADLVSSQITSAMQIILKDQNTRRSVANNEKYMVNLNVAAEMYFMNAIHKHLFSTITACVKSDDATVNKMTRNLTEIRLHHLGVRKEFDQNLPTARKELSRLNHFSTPLGRLLCMKRVMTSLTKPLSKASQNAELVMTTDDFLPLLIYLIIKSHINNWTANLMYMKYFHQPSAADSDILSFYLTTTEAALDYIKSGDIKIDNSQASPQKVSRPVGSSDPPGFKRQASSGTSAKSKFFQYVQFGDEAAVTLMLKRPKKDGDEVLSQLCHPLCSCDKCSDIVSKSKRSAREVSALSRDDMGRTALHIAAFNGQAGLIDILVKNGSLVDASDYLGCTPLHLACQKGFQNIILLLVHFGSDIGTIDNEGNTPLHLCAKNGHEDCVKAILFLDILKSKLNVNAQNDMGDTPLHLAAKWGYEGIVKFLLETEADARTRNRKRQTPLSLAQNLTIKRMLQSAFDDPPPIVVTHQQPKKPIHLSVRANSSLKSSHSQPHTSSSPSATSATASPSLKPATSCTPTQQPQPEANTAHISQEKSPMGFAVVDIKPAGPPKELIDNSSRKMMAPKIPVVASLDNIDYRQVDKLFTAISNKDIELVKFYLGWIDSPDVDDEGSPRLGDPGDLCHPLCQCPKCQPIQKISRGSNLHVDCCNKKGFTPLHISAMESYMVAFKLFLRKGANVNKQTHRNITALHLACFHNSPEMVEMLVARGADVNLEDQYGEIPLHLAAAKNNIEIVQILLQHSSTINLANVDGNTPLHRAAASNAVESLQLLLENGADPNRANNNRQLPFNVTKNKDIQELLLEKQSQMKKKMAAISEMHEKPRDDTKLNERIARLQKMLTTLEGRDLRAWQELGKSIRSFPVSHSLKRSKTFDHSDPLVDSPDLRLSLSIKHFDKEKTLKRRQTIDKSIPYLKPFKHSLTIQHFDSGTLRHVDSVDKSSPMHMFSLAQRFSSYSNYLDTPVEGRELSFGSLGESETHSGEVTCDSLETLESVDKELKESNEDSRKSAISEGNKGEKSHEVEEDLCDSVEFKLDSEEIHVDNNEIVAVYHKSGVQDNTGSLFIDKPSAGSEVVDISADIDTAEVDDISTDRDTAAVHDISTDIDTAEGEVAKTKEDVNRDSNGEPNIQSDLPEKSSCQNFSLANQAVYGKGESVDDNFSLVNQAVSGKGESSDQNLSLASECGKGESSDRNFLLENQYKLGKVESSDQNFSLANQSLYGKGDGDQCNVCDISTDKCDSNQDKDKVEETIKTKASHVQNMDSPDEPKTGNKSDIYLADSNEKNT